MQARVITCRYVYGDAGVDGTEAGGSADRCSVPAVGSIESPCGKLAGVGQANTPTSTYQPSLKTA